MRLTKKLRNQITIELWTFLAETGKTKEDWVGWDKYGGYMSLGCPLCEYDVQHKGDERCPTCPLMKAGYRRCGDDRLAYYQWEDAETKREMKKYAKLFLAQLKEILK